VPGLLQGMCQRDKRVKMTVTADTTEQETLRPRSIQAHYLASFTKHFTMWEGFITRPFDRQFILK
jgi:hypothetical protein